jgi:DNA-binding NarL/FixJ family response regulator
MATYQTEFAEHHGTITRIICARVRGRDRHERRQNALCHAWMIFCLARDDSKSTESAVIIAATIGARRSSEPFASTRYPGQQDMMDVAEQLAPHDDVADDRQGESTDFLEQLDSRLSARQQAIVRLLIDGHSKVECAAFMNVSPSTVTNDCAAIAKHI